MVGGPNSGDCIFRSLRTKASNYEATRAKDLYELQLAGEYRWKDDAVGVTVMDPDGGKVAKIVDQTMELADFEFTVVRLMKSGEKSSQAK